MEEPWALEGWGQGEVCRKSFDQEQTGSQTLNAKMVRGPARPRDKAVGSSLQAWDRGRDGAGHCFSDSITGLPASSLPARKVSPGGCLLIWRRHDLQKVPLEKLTLER